MGNKRFAHFLGAINRRMHSRPIVLAGKGGEVYVVFRDEERGSGISVSQSRDAARTNWRTFEISTQNVGLWEPTYDPAAWARDGKLHVLVQRVGQGDAERLEDVAPQPVSVLEWTP